MSNIVAIFFILGIVACFIAYVFYLAFRDTNLKSGKASFEKNGDSVKGSIEMKSHEEKNEEKENDSSKRPAKKNR